MSAFAVISGLAACVGADAATTTAADAGVEAGTDAPVTGAEAGIDSAVTPDAAKPCTLAKGTSGAKDPSFQQGVKAAITANQATAFKAHGGFMSSGAIYVYGGAPGCAGTAVSPGIVRYTASGDLDTAFGVGGLGCIAVPGAGAEPWQGARDPKTGRIVMVGNSSGSGLSVVCLKADGKADTGCLDGVGNVVMGLPSTPTTAYPGGVTALGVAFDSKGRIVIVGGDGDPFTKASFGFVLRLNPASAAIDPTFNAGKPVYVAGVSGFSALHIDDQDAIYVGGAIAAGADAGTWRVYKYTTAGALETDVFWAAGGGFNAYRTADSSAEDIPRRLVASSDGTLAMAGAGNGHPSVNLYSTTGLLDKSYSASAPTTWNTGYVLDGLAAQCDGKVLLGGWADPTQAGAFLTRIDPVTGTVDPGFAGIGSLTVATDAFVSVMFDETNGMIVLVENHANTGVALYRYVP